MILIKFIKKKLERYRLSEERITNPGKYKFITTFYQAVIEVIEREQDKLSHRVAQKTKQLCCLSYNCYLLNFES